MESTYDDKPLSNREVPAGVKFVLQGFDHLLSQVTFSELKKFRLVCKYWNEGVIHHRRFVNSWITFEENQWRHGSQCFSLDTANSRWRKIHFTFFPFASYRDWIFDNCNDVFRQFWTIDNIGERVTHLYFSDIERIICTDLINFLNEQCPSIRHITLESISWTRHFLSNVSDEDDYGYPSTLTLVGHETNCKSIQIISSCTKLQSIIIKSQIVLPLCVIDFLSERCKGSLMQFQYSSCNSADVIRNGYLPTRDQIEDRLMSEIIAPNQATLKCFTWTYNTKGNFINKMANNNLTNLKLNELTLIPDSRWSEVETNFGLSLLKSQKLSKVTKLYLCVQRATDWEQYTRAILSLDIKYLYKFYVKFAGSKDILDETFTITEIVKKITNLKELSTSEFKNRFYFPGFSPNHLQVLPSTLTSLSLYHRVLLTDILYKAMSFLTPLQLTKLMITSGANCTDEILQMIIERCDLLEELTINNAYRLTDVGITGYDKQFCTLVKNDFDINLESVLLMNNLVQGCLRGYSISDLKQLRVLNLRGCSKLTNVSLYFGVVCPNLTILDISFVDVSSITEFQLRYLSLSCPSLEELIIEDTRGLTAFGLYKFMKSSKSIKKIFVTEPAQIYAYQEFLTVPDFFEAKNNLITFTDGN